MVWNPLGSALGAVARFTSGTRQTRFIIKRPWPLPNDAIDPDSKMIRADFDGWLVVDRDIKSAAPRKFTGTKQACKEWAKRRIN